MDLAALDAALGPWRAERRALAASRAARWRELLPGPLGERKARWWDARARTKGYSERVADCGTHGRACDHCGFVLVRRCGARMVCDACRKAGYGKVARRMARALDGHLQQRLTAWRASGRPARGEPRIALVTLTVRHSGDPTADRRLLSTAWHRWRAWYRYTYGENLPYAWLPEYTPGRDDLGHVHVHVCTILPWRDFSALIDAWRNATGDHEARIHVSTRTRGVRGAAKYVAKYASKGVNSLTVEHAEKWIRAQHQMRAVSTSRGFYAPDPVSKHGPWTAWSRLSDGAPPRDLQRVWYAATDVERASLAREAATSPRAGPDSFARNEPATGA